jgi:hypothetical protein
MPPSGENDAQPDSVATQISADIPTGIAGFRLNAVDTVRMTASPALLDANMKSS